MGDAAQVLAAARARGWRIAVAESCTGGLIGAALTEVAGSSDVLDRGFITYSNQAKMDLLGVSASALAAHGAVSEQVAQEMATGALAASKVDIAVSVTGIAGPGGSEHKPEGMVCFGIATPKGTQTDTQLFGPLGRDAVRRAAVDHALDLLMRAIVS
ncbi:CinA family protein [uncultured Litoreibacter sp.]|uniref:CinA family protein n=1 Tax=uncultured Litoreibacter sp. TaxID=1392394 RepID=UPI00260A235F|nr:CinA family protein [uncultured Litoreibacter sp.]